MDKLSNDKVAEVLLDAKNALLAVTEERNKLAAENSDMKRRIEAEKLASAMHQKGIKTDMDLDELAAELEKEADTGRFDVIQQAVDLVAPNMGMNAGTLTHDDVTGEGASALEQYIFGKVG